VNPPLRYLRGSGIVTAGCFSSAGDFGPALKQHETGIRPWGGQGRTWRCKHHGITSKKTLTPARGVAPRGREPAAGPP
jgi:hypothetical protein